MNVDSPGRGDKCSTACAARRTACSEGCLASDLSGQQTSTLGRRRSGFRGVVSSTFGTLTRNEISARKTRRGGDSQARSRLASLHSVGAERTRGNLRGRRGRAGGCVAGGNGRARDLTGGETGGGCRRLQGLAGDRTGRNCTGRGLEVAVGSGRVVSDWPRSGGRRKVLTPTKDWR